MSLNKPFQHAPSAIASYNYTDISSGTGITDFYAGQAALSGSSVSYILSNVAFYSNSVATANYTGTDGTYTEKFDIDFDVVINRPFRIGGIVMANIPMKCQHEAGSAGASADFYVIVKLRKWDGTTETEIASNTTKNVNTSVGVTTYDISAVYLNIPETNFKKGETLRLSTIGYASRTQDGNYNVQMAYDPKNRAIGWDASGSPSSLIVQIPQKLDTD